MYIKEEKAYMEIIGEIGDWDYMPDTYMFNPEKVMQLKATRERLYDFIGKKEINGKIHFSTSPSKFGDVLISFRVKDFIVWDTKVFLFVTEYLSDFCLISSGLGGMLFSGTIENVAVDLNFEEETDNV